MICIKDSTDDERKKLTQTDSTVVAPIIYYLTFVSQISILCEGYENGSTSGAVLIIENNDYIKLTSMWKEAIISGALPGIAISCLIAAWFSDRFGRKKCIMFSSCVLILAAIVTSSSYSREILLVGRFLTGIGIGLSGATSCLYVAECSPKSIRGCLLANSQIFYIAGVLFGTTTAALFSSDITNGWRYIWGMQAIIASIQLTGLFFVPESPRWLIQKSSKEEAKEVLMKIRSEKDIENEFQEIVDNLTEIQASNENSGEGNVFMRMLKTRPVRRALMVGFGLHIFGQFSGGKSIVYYSGIIIQMSGIGNVTNAIWNVVIINLINFIFGFIGIWLMDSIGRRKLAIIVYSGISFSVFFLGTTFFMAAKYSPPINFIEDIFPNYCSTYSHCNDCIKDAKCGFCYENIPNGINGSCLPVNIASNLISEQGTCNSTITLSDHSINWAYGYCPVSFSWVATLGLALVLIFYSLGVGSLPWTVNSEIYPLWARSIGCGITAMTQPICIMIWTASFLSLVELIQIYGIFFMMGSVALIGLIFFFFFLPETKNKSLEEINALFSADKVIVGWS